MTTITLKINDNSVMGKSFLAFLKTFVAKDKSVEIINVPNTGLQESIADYKAGRVIKAKNATELLKKLKA